MPGRAVENSTRGASFIAISAISSGLIPIFAELSYQAGAGVYELLFVRFLIAFGVMGIILAATRRLALPSRRDLALMLALGLVGYFVTSSSYFTSLLYSPIPIAVLLLYTYPAFVTVGSRLLGWEGINRRIAGSVGVAIVGLVLVANPFGGALGLGAAFALLASFTWTGYTLASTGLLKRVRGELASFFVMGAVCISFGLAAFLSGPVSFGWQPIGWVWILLLATVCSVVQVTTFFLGLALIGPSRASLISLLEPVTSVVLSFVIFGQALVGVQAVGGSLILFSALVVATSKPARLGGS